MVGLVVPKLAADVTEGLRHSRFSNQAKMAAIRRPGFCDELSIEAEGQFMLIPNTLLQTGVDRPVQSLQQSSNAEPGESSLLNRPSQDAACLGERS